jgi:hypothetical protein
MDGSTRPPQKRHQAARHLAFGLVAVFILSLPGALAATRTLEQDSTQPNISATAPAAHDIAVTTVAPGDEGFELSARFSETSVEAVKGIEWLITDNTGTPVFDGISTIADAKLPAGDYHVIANYGTAHIVQGLTVHEGTKLVVSFVLNAGGLRVLPRVKNLGLPTVPSESKIYALTGLSRGKLISSSFTPGEVIKVAAGDYRVESKFESGNAVSITDVHVRAGVMSAINIDHIAGIAHLSCTTQNPVQWTVVDENGIAISATAGAQLNLVLQPGTYTAKATSSEIMLHKTFTISQGQNLNIKLED